MPTYDYLCNECGCEFEQAHGFHDEPSPCESCGSPDIKKVINQAPMAFVKGEATTLGHLAERNTSKMGRYELGDRRGQQQEADQKTKKPKEWWQKSGDATKKDISKMSDKQKSDYIFKGKK
tara:strand:- start:1864 stop:2226 length:363 start_codon:yes stop_codon:yes gene_type:complete